MNLLDKATELEERAAAMRASMAGKPVEMLCTKPGERGHPDWCVVIPQWAENKRYRVAQDPLAKGHNPDSLTVSQVGEGWRLLDGDEIKHRGREQAPLGTIEAWGGNWDAGASFYAGCDNKVTYRTRLSRAELAALDKPAWKLSRHIEGFRPLEDGEEWHRIDFLEDMLPSGWRPLLLGEVPASDEDQYNYYGAKDPWYNCKAGEHGEPWDAATASERCRIRTRRPLPVKDVPWDCQSDFPCGARIVHQSCTIQYIPTDIRSDGVTIHHDKEVHVIRWHALASYYTWTTDGKTFSPCTKPGK